MKAKLGGKGAGLAEMSRAGVPVPPGFTIVTDVCNLFFDNGQTVPKEVDEQIWKALEKLEIINQPLASIAKKEEILYILGREDDPCVLDRHSPVLHLIQQIRDETHRFAVTFHRHRRSKQRIRTSLVEIPGIGDRTAQKLLRRFGSVARLRTLSVDDLTAEVPRNQAQKVFDALHESPTETRTA